MGFFSSIGGLVNDILGGSDSASNAYKYQRALASYNNAMNEDFYLKYQTPKAYMQQLQDAGLNPNLAYNQSASSITSSIPSASSGPGGSGGSLAGMAKSLFEYLGTKKDKEKAETAVADATVGNINARTEAQSLNNALMKDKVKFKNDTGIDPTTPQGSVIYGTVNAGKSIGDYLTSHGDSAALKSKGEDIIRANHKINEAKKSGKKVDLWDLL